VAGQIFKNLYFAKMRAVTEFESLFIHRDFIDMRKNINGLALIVKEEMKLELKSASIFMFCNRKRNLMKILYFDKSGFALWMKKLECSKFPWPKDAVDEVVEASSYDVEMLLDGINVWSKFKEVHFEELI